MPSKLSSIVACIKAVAGISAALKNIRGKDLEMFKDKIPTSKELDSFSELLTPLLMITSVLDKFQAEKTPTVHLVLPLICKIGTLSRSDKFKTSSKMTRAVVLTFEAGLKVRMKNFGKQEQAYRFGNFLHPSFKGSLLNFDEDDYSYGRTIREIKALFPEEQQDSESKVS